MHPQLPHTLEGGIDSRGLGNRKLNAKGKGDAYLERIVNRLHLRTTVHVQHGRVLDAEREVVRFEHHRVQYIAGRDARAVDGRIVLSIFRRSTLTQVAH